MKILILAATLLLGACAGSGQTKSDDPRETRRDLAEGYSLLNSDLQSLDRTRLVLYVKEESDAVDELVSDVSDFAGKARKELERLSKAYPAARIDLQPLPEMEKRKRDSMLKERMKEYAPVTGKGGKPFERALLSTLRSGLSQQRHLCKVMAEVEPEPGLRKFLLDTQRGLDRQFERVDRFYAKHYYK